MKWDQHGVDQREPNFGGRGDSDVLPSWSEHRPKSSFVRWPMQLMVLGAGKKF
jgi:hypothetical protein